MREVQALGGILVEVCDINGQVEDRPYPNEHSARLKDPKQYDEFRRQNNKFGRGIHAIFGIKTKPKRTSELQAIRFDAKLYTVAQAKKWLKDHNYKPILFESASGEKTMPAETFIEMPVLYREASIDVRSVDKESRTVSVVFSTETPCRRWFGWEVLSHDPKHANFDRLRNVGSVLINHNPDLYIGKPVNVRIEDKKGQADIRFGTTPRAELAWQDVLEENLRGISIGYIPEHATLTKVEKDEEGRETKWYLVDKWSGIEFSLTPIPLDPNSAVGHSDGPQFRAGEQVYRCRISDDAAGKELHDMGEETGILLEEPAPVAPAPTPRKEPAVEQMRDAAVEAERTRAKEILNLGGNHGQPELARKFVEEGKTAEQFVRALLDLKRKDADAVQGFRQVPDPTTIGMSQKDQRRFSFHKLINALAFRDDKEAQNAAGFELEACRAQAKAFGQQPRGAFLPVDLIVSDHGMTPERRDVTVTGEGADLVQTDVLGAKFIDILRAKLITAKFSTLLTGLKGNVLIPTLTAGSAAAFVAENAAPSEQTPTFGQLALSPKSIRAYLEVSRLLLVQSTPAVEMILRNDLAKAMAAKIDDVTIEGGGSNEPTGITGTSGIGDVAGGTNGLAPAWSHIIELWTDVAAADAVTDANTCAYATTPEIVGKLKQTVKATGEVIGFIWNDNVPDKPVNGYPCFYSSQVPSDLDKGTSEGVCHAILFGDWSEVVQGFWEQMDFIVDPYTLATTNLIRITVLHYCDVGLRHAASFSAMLDALAS